MDELKLIVETMNSLGGEAKEAFIVWLVVAKVAFPAIIMTGIGLLIKMAFKMTIKCINAWNETETSLLSHWRNELKIGCPGILTSLERVQTIQRINQLIRESIKQ